MPATDDLVLLLQRLGSDAALQASFLANPSAATQPFHLTGHERDAVVTRDLDDFVALGVVASIWELPEVLRGPSLPQGPAESWLQRLKQMMQKLLGMKPPPVHKPDPGPVVPPHPLPDPGPQPGPGPGPGPDPGP